MDAQRIERQVFDSYGFTAGKFREIFFLDTSSDNFGQLNYTVSSTNETAYYLHRNVVERCRNDMGLRTIMEEEYEQLLKDREMLRYIMSPLPSSLLSSSLVHILPIPPPSTLSLTPRHTSSRSLPLPLSLSHPDTHPPDPSPFHSHTQTHILPTRHPFSPLTTPSISLVISLFLLTIISSE